MRYLHILFLGLFLWTGVAQAAPPSPYAVAVKDATCQPYEGPPVTFKTGEAVEFVDQIEIYKTCKTGDQEFDCTYIIPLDGRFVMDLPEWEDAHFTPAEKAGIQCMADALTVPKS
jgi:hypothetical protein